MEHYKYHIILSLMAEEKQTDKISYFVTAFIHKVKINNESIVLPFTFIYDIHTKKLATKNVKNK
jgi:hypothetical protein